ncbi:MAG: hypothetical protein IKL24_03840 [Clostridia bacterium]|nr:hypothetical protein [Clostridia bacterium]
MAETVFDNGIISLVVPEGWNAFGATDSEGNETASKVFVYKNAREPFEIFSKAGITVCFFGRDKYYFSPKAFYDDVCDIEPFTLGDHLWEGYTCKSLGYPYVMLEGRKNGCVFQIMVLLENGEERISMEDADVRRIIGSISATEEGSRT